MKKISRISVFLVIVLNLVSCNGKNTGFNEDNMLTQANEAKYRIDKTDMNDVISDYITIRLSGFRPVYKKFEAHEIYGVEEKDDKLIVYLYFSLDGYSFSDGYFKSETGTNTGAIVELTEKEGEYEIISFEEMLTNDEIIDRFPKEYAEKALYGDHKGLYDEVRRKVNNWLKAERRTEEIKEY
ncbi:hypothetical protein [Tissierella praeacuta]|uniref:hypothetical protein n=1 Tax=Tissierella praeacuta TaxID=43131 RepID=UPI00333EBD50